METKIYVFDLDNTLCNTEGCDYLGAQPIEERIHKVNTLYDEGHTIIIDTARGCISGKNWFYQTAEQLKSWGLRFHTLRTNTKFMADEYVDDKAANSEDFFSNSNNLNSESGSGASTNVVIVSRVLKEATDERVDKLIDEINFLESIPIQFRDKFPKIIFSKHDKEKAFYEMQHHQLPTIRRLILSGDMDADEILYWSDKITKFSMKMYKHEKANVSEDRFFKVLHWDRFENRMRELSTKSLWFKEKLQQKSIVINDVEYPNITTLYHTLKNNQNQFKPEFIGRWSHSDLHFSNILIDRENDNFVLIDPRGYEFCDYYYDYGKLWHSVNGKYELIAARMFEVSPMGDHHHFEIHKNTAFRALDDAKQPIMDMMISHAGQAADDVVLKTEFNDVMHFATLLPFLLEFDNQESRARCAYYQSVLLMNQFYNKHLKGLSL